MSEHIDNSIPPVQSLPSDPVTEQTQQTNAPAQSALDKEIASLESGFINSVGDLKTKAPTVHKEMVRSLAETIIKDMRQAQDRFKKAMRGY